MADDIKEIELTVRCKIATYYPEEIRKYHTELDQVIQKRIKDFVGQLGVVSNTESRMEGKF
jgi:hypothetical protein